MADKYDIKLTMDGRTLTKSIQKVSDSVISELNQAVKNLAHAAYAKITAIAQERLSKTRQDYLKGLKLQPLGDNSYLVSLEGEWANKIETGFSAFSMKDILLNSKKIVQVGKRSGSPWVQRSKQNNRFAHVPIDHKPFSKESKTADLNAVLKKMTGYGRNGINQKLTKIFKDPHGNALEGKVAVGRSENPLLDQIVKYQKTYPDKKVTQSIYITYRTVSDLSKGWKHKGYQGLKAFEETEKWVATEIDNIIKNLGK